MSVGKTTRFQNNIRVDGNLDLSSSTGNLTLSSLSSAPASPTVGDFFYDSTLGKARVYQSTGWTNVDGSAAGSLDAAYNGGQTITVDAADVLFNLSDASNDYCVVIDCAVDGTVTDAWKITTTGGASAVFSDAIDVSDAGIVNAINVGANVIYGTGGASIDFDAFDVDSSGNVTVGGTGTITGATTLSSTLALASTLTSEGAIIVDIDAAEAFLIRENGDAADVVTVDTTQDAGDTTFAISSKTTSGKALYLDLDTITGQGLDINAATITTGDALRIVVASGTMTAAGAAISVLDGVTEVFAVRDDGSIYSKATAEGTTAFQVATGDVLISDGDLTVSGGEVAFTSDSTTAGLVIVNNAITTANSLVDVSSTSITSGALMRLNANTVTHDGEILELISAGDTTSTGTGLSITMPDITTGVATGINVTMAKLTTSGFGILVRMDAITTGDMLYLDNGGGTMTAGSGYFINCNDDNVTKFGVSLNGNTTIAGTDGDTAAITLALGNLVLTDTNATTITSVNGTGSIVKVISGGDIGAEKACLEVDAAGTFDADGSLLRLSAEGITATNSPYALNIDCAALDMGAIRIVSAPATNSCVLMTTTGVLAADKAIVELVSNANGCNGDSSVLRLDQTHIGGAAFCMTARQDDLDVGFINFEGTASANENSPISTHGTGTVTDFVRCAINGTKAWIPVVTGAVSA